MKNKKSGFRNGIISMFSLMLLITHHTAAQYAVTRLAYPVNTKDYDEICPVMNASETVLFFTRSGSANFNKTLFYDGQDLSEYMNSEEYDENLKKIYSLVAGRKVDDPYTSSFNQDVWMTHFKDGNIDGIYHPGYPLNDALTNSICSTYGHDDQFVVINQFEKTGGMQEGFSVVKQNEDGSFDFPIPFRIRGFEKSASEVNLTMSYDLQHIIMAFEDPKTSGKKDLYLSLKILDTLYSEPIKISAINTPYNETTPFISQDKTTLYFASDRPGGFGGLDIYYCKREDLSYTSWSTPIRLGPPLNTNANESHPYVTNDLQKIFYTSDKEVNSDIFSAKLNRPKTLSKDVKVILNITREDTGKNGPAEIYWKETYSGKNQNGYVRTKNGIYEYQFENNEVLTFSAENRAYRSQEFTIDPQDLIESGKDAVFLDLVMTKEGILKRAEEVVSDKKEEEVQSGLAFNTGLGKTTVLDNIYFVRSRPEVVAESFATLRKLAAGLKTRPNMIIRVEGHTDNVGDKDALKELSESRASYIKAFLIREGVKEDQVLTAGFGDEKPISDNSNEKARKINRRVEIRVIRE